jgi:hypothetical protein
MFRTRTAKSYSVNLRPTFSPITPEQHQRAAELPRLNVAASTSSLLVNNDEERTAKEAAYHAWLNGENLHPSMEEILWICS